MVKRKKKIIQIISKGIIKSDLAVRKMLGKKYYTIPFHIGKNNLVYKSQKRKRKV